MQLKICSYSSFTIYGASGAVCMDLYPDGPQKPAQPTHESRRVTVVVMPSVRGAVTLCGTSSGRRQEFFSVAAVIVFSLSSFLSPYQCDLLISAVLDTRKTHVYLNLMYLIVVVVITIDQ